MTAPQRRDVYKGTETKGLSLSMHSEDTAQYSVFQNKLDNLF